MRLPPLNWLRDFEASARALSFTAAAQELHMTQSAVSEQIKSLENALGRTLFYRRVCGLELTDEGRGYLPTVQAAFATLEEGTAVLVGRNDPDVLELHANLSFGIFWLTPRLGRFMDEHPWVHLNIATSIWPQEKPSDSAAVEIVFGQGKWESRVGQRLSHDSVFPACAPALAEQIHAAGSYGTLRMREVSPLQFSAGHRVVALRTEPMTKTAFQLDEVELTPLLVDARFPQLPRPAGRIPRGAAGNTVMIRW